MLLHAGYNVRALFPRHIATQVNVPGYNRQLQIVPIDEWYNYEFPPQLLDSITGVVHLDYPRSVDHNRVCGPLSLYSRVER